MHLNQWLAAEQVTVPPGCVREMHWHPNADEWGFVLEGSAQIGIFGAHGRSKQEQFAKGDVFFVQQGFGHYIKNTGNGKFEAIIVFNSPRYQQISLSEWLGANPTQLISDNFSISNDVTDKLPTELIGIVKKRS